MKNIFDKAKESELFAGISDSEFKAMLNDTSAYTKTYAKDDFIVLAGDRATSAGIMLSGFAKVIKEGLGGESIILKEIAPSEMFGEVFACAAVSVYPVTVQASDRCEVLFVDIKKIMDAPSYYPYAAHLTSSMLKIVSKKNLFLNQKIEILSKRTIRARLMHFFDFYSNDKSKFSVPLNREEMAQFLCVDRSALSAELCKMRDEGLITFRKNTFEILY